MDNYRFNDEKIRWGPLRVSRSLKDFFCIRYIPILIIIIALLIFGSNKYLVSILIILFAYSFWDIFRHDNEKTYSVRGNKVYFSYGDYTYSWVKISRIKEIELRENKKRDEYLVLKGTLLKKKIYPQSASYMKDLIESRMERK